MTTITNQTEYDAFIASGNTSHTVTVTTSFAATLSQINALNTRTTGLVTIQLMSGTSSEITSSVEIESGIDISGSAAILTDSHNLNQLLTINNSISGTITLNNNTVQLSGSSSDIML